MFVIWSLKTKNKNWNNSIKNICIIHGRPPICIFFNINNISSCSQQTCATMVYNYTKPRGPVAAMYSSPGPCYALPGLVGQIGHDPRSVHFKGPAYAFGIRHGKFSDDCSPGPCYFPDAKIYRDGRDGTPHYSLYGRHQELTSFKVLTLTIFPLADNNGVQLYELENYKF